MFRAAVAAALFTTACTRAEPVELHVAAAASLSGPLEEAARACEGAGGRGFLFNFGASNDLARQIRSGAPADLFISADADLVADLDAAGFLAPESRRAFLSNRLAVIVPIGSDFHYSGADSLADPAVRVLSIADPAIVPAGRYARSWLSATGVWEKVRERVLPGVDVRAALAAVESGGAECGVVYRTDAAMSAKVRIVHEVAGAEAPEISYAAAVLGSSAAPSAARSALDCLVSPQSRAIFERRGFLPPLD